MSYCWSWSAYFNCRTWWIRLSSFIVFFFSLILQLILLKILLQVLKSIKASSSWWMITTSVKYIHDLHLKSYNCIQTTLHVVVASTSLLRSTMVSGWSTSTSLDPTPSPTPWSGADSPGSMTMTLSCWYLGVESSGTLVTRHRLVSAQVSGWVLRETSDRICSGYVSSPQNIQCFDQTSDFRPVISCSSEWF